MRIPAEVPAGDLAAEGEPLEVEKARGALQVGQRVGVLGGQTLELGPAGHLPFQHVHQRLVVALEHPEETGNVAAEIVDRLHLRRRAPAQEHAAHADEGLGIEPMGRGLDRRDDAAGADLLAADIAGDRTDGRDHPEGCHLV